jgi:hypothetical protein
MAGGTSDWHTQAHKHTNRHGRHLKGLLSALATADPSTRTPPPLLSWLLAHACKTHSHESRRRVPALHHCSHNRHTFSTHVASNRPGTTAHAPAHAPTGAAPTCISTQASPCRMQRRRGPGRPHPARPHSRTGRAFSRQSWSHPVPPSAVWAWRHKGPTDQNTGSGILTRMTFTFTPVCTLFLFQESV